MCVYVYMCIYIVSWSSEDAAGLRAHLVSLEAAIAEETAIVAQCQHEFQLLSVFHDRHKSDRDQLQLDLRDILREKSSLEEKNAYELSVYKEKVKNLLLDHTSVVSERRVETATAYFSLDLENSATTETLNEEERKMKLLSREVENNHLKLIQAIKTGQESNIVGLREEYERKCTQLKNQYEKKMKSKRESEEKKKKEEINRLELKKNNQIQELMAKHKRKFDKIKKYFSDITHANLELIKNLKEEVGDMKKKENAFSSQVNTIRRLNNKLSTPLAENQAKVIELEKQLILYQEDKKKLNDYSKYLKELNEEYEKNEWEYEVLIQKFEQIHKEKQALESEYSRVIESKSQSHNFSSLVLKKQIHVLTRELEKAEAGLSEILISSHLDPAGVSSIEGGLEAVLNEKNSLIQALEDELAEWRTRYRERVELYEEELRRLAIPLEELGFVLKKHI